MKLAKLIKNSIGGVIVITLAVGSTKQAVNLIQNGSFENTAGTFVNVPSFFILIECDGKFHKL